MIRISLNEEEKTALKKLRINKRSSVRERAHYVLLSNDGKSVPEIAQYLSRNGHTIRLWLQRYKTDGILVWNYHEGRTISTINFNYDAYANLL